MCAHNPFCGYCGVCLQHWQTHGPPIDRFCSLVAIPTLSLITTMLRSQKNCMTDCICEVPCICRPALAFQMSNNHKFCLVEGGSWSTRENSLVGAGPLFPKGYLERIHGRWRRGGRGEEGVLMNRRGCKLRICPRLRSCNTRLLFPDD